MRWWILLFALLPALAQAPGLTQEEARILDRLVEEALPRDPVYLKTLADLEAARQTLGILGAVSAEVGAALAGEYGQVAPSYRLSLSLNLVELFRDKGPALRALEAQAEAQRREVRLRVAGAFFRWLSAREAARAAADGVEAREAELKALQARARVGAATPAEVLAAAERVSQARLALYRANLDLALALEDLARAAGLTLDALRGLLRPLETKGGTSGAPPGSRGP
ncbi:TolC family protein [Thermus amyloliquefaciens]|uniref:TolC family protein n=1 Tax=Thermus amyloliquefaciens TaxID=1449080 RepID=UPI0005712A4D|nr:TolC family protein [Thermus amyloliquefaciens]